MPFLPGFDERWQDAPDFINGLTQEVWDERRVERLSRYHEPEVAVRTPARLMQGGAAVTAEAQAEMAAFPDGERLSEEVIWGLTGYKSFYASQRLYCTGTHEGPGPYGAPCGRRISYRMMVDRWCRGNAVAEAWEIRDESAILKQLGQEPQDRARGLIAREGGPEACLRPLTPLTDVPSRYDGLGNDNEWGHTLADLLSRMMAGEMSVIPRHYDRAAELARPGASLGSGRGEAERFWMALRAALPSARFGIAHALGIEEPLSAPRASVRWVLSGRHDGWGMFGAPSGTEVHVMGITQAEFGPRGLRREWTLIDEVAVWKQVVLGAGAVTA